MFETLTIAPPDAIFGLNEAIRRDPRPEKINLGAGVYKDEAGKTPVFAAVKEAERRLVASQPSKNYLPMDGYPEFIRGVQRLLFGGEHEILSEGRAATVQTPGGTGALRVAGDFLKQAAGASRLWLSEPTWPNHPQIFGAVDLPIQTYAYFSTETNGLDFPGLVRSLEAARPGDVVLLHGTCHNPTGVDPDLEQWAQIAELLAGRGALPLVDFAYQGLAHGLEADVEWLRVLAARVPEMVVCTSYSKNFGLYNERVGALTLVARNAENAEAALSQIKRTVRANYSNPPAHGAEVVATSSPT
ncbi:MAG: aspartate/tyrosine/aromatic aminotransferase, partial [Thermoanaerobaculia bacterium]|nr:aspartate/tyrosine/aromatic aminotransferase [Thermoanaerobaculia bacterium]